MVAVLPEFDPDSIESMIYEVKVGEAWDFYLPKPLLPHDLGYTVEYDTVELGLASIFAEYLEGVQMIRVPAGATTEDNVGEYSIQLRLID